MMRTGQHLYFMVRPEKLASSKGAKHVAGCFIAYSLLLGVTKTACQVPGILLSLAFKLGDYYLRIWQLIIIQGYLWDGIHCLFVFVIGEFL